MSREITITCNQCHRVIAPTDRLIVTQGVIYHNAQDSITHFDSGDVRRKSDPDVRFPAKNNLSAGLDFCSTLCLRGYVDDLCEELDG
jgi:hypothetical protein